MQTIGLPTVASERTSQPAPSFLYVRTYAHHITQKRVVVFRFASVICNIYFLCDCCCCICVSHMICAYLWLRLAAYTNNALWLIYQRGVSASFLTGYEVGFRFGMAKLGWTHGKRWTKNVQKSWILFLGRLGTHVRRYHSAYCITCMAILADDLVIDFYDGCNRHTYVWKEINQMIWLTARTQKKLDSIARTSEPVNTLEKCIRFLFPRQKYNKSTQVHFLVCLTNSNSFLTSFFDGIFCAGIHISNTFSYILQAQTDRQTDRQVLSS